MEDMGRLRRVGNGEVGGRQEVAAPPGRAVGLGNTGFGARRKEGRPER